MLGTVDQGWSVVQEVLAFERVGIARYARCERLLQWAPAALGDAPPAGGAAQRGGGLELVGVSPGVELPRAEVGEHLRGAVVAARRGMGEVVAAGGLQCPPGRVAVLDGFGAEVEVHAAASRVRASRIRCISMLPDATVADTA